jgi:hypothetical protein
MNAAPTCIADVLVDRPRFPAGVCRAANRFAKSKPFRGEYEERCDKFTATVALLNEACDMNVGVRFVGAEDQSTSLNSFVDWSGGEDKPVIVMVGKLSATTLLYLYAGCMTPFDGRMGGHWGRMRWAANLMKRFFPRSFAGLDTSGIFLLRRGESVPPSIDAESDVAGQ